VSTANRLRMPSVLAPVNAASAAGVHLLLSAASTAGTSLARCSGVRIQASPRAAKNSAIGPPPCQRAVDASRTGAAAADGSTDGSLYGSGATGAPRGGAGCTTSARRLHPFPPGAAAAPAGPVIHGLAAGVNGARPLRPLSLAARARLRSRGEPDAQPWELLLNDGRGRRRAGPCGSGSGSSPSRRSAVRYWLP
jgi:hypothetical protein